jgi:hypothetical protein
MPHLLFHVEKPGCTVFLLFLWLCNMCTVSRAYLVSEASYMQSYDLHIRLLNFLLFEILLLIDLFTHLVTHYSCSVSSVL